MKSVASQIDCSIYIRYIIRFYFEAGVGIFLPTPSPIASCNTPLLVLIMSYFVLSAPLCHTCFLPNVHLNFFILCSCTLQLLSFLNLILLLFCRCLMSLVSCRY